MLLGNKKTANLQRSAVSVTAAGAALVSVDRSGVGRPVVRSFSQLSGESSAVVALETLRRDHHLGTAPVATLLNKGEYELHSIEAPNVPESELKQAIRWQLKDVLEYAPEEATLDVLPLPTERLAAGRPRNMFAVSARNAVVASRMRDFDAAKLALQVIDIPELAQRNVAALFEAPGRALAMVSFSTQGGTFTVTCDGELYLARSLEITASQIAAGLDAAQIERIALELQRSLDHFDRQFGGIVVSRLLIAPLAGAPALRDAFAENLYVPVEVLDLNEALDFEAAPALREPEAQAQYLLLIGLALRSEPEVLAA